MIKYLGTAEQLVIQSASVCLSRVKVISISVDQLVISPPRSRVVPCKIYRLIYKSGYGGIGRRVWFSLRYDSEKISVSRLCETVFYFIVFFRPLFRFFFHIDQRFQGHELQLLRFSLSDVIDEKAPLFLMK